MPAQIFTDSERPDLYDRLDELADPWPEFIHHDEVVIERWPLLHERLPDFQLILHDSETDTVLGRGCTIPVPWDGRNESLSGGVVDALVEGFADVAEANVLCALVAVVDPRQQGRGLSGNIIVGMAEAAGRAGLECLIAPVRPTWKECLAIASRVRPVLSTIQSIAVSRAHRLEWIPVSTTNLQARNCCA